MTTKFGVGEYTMRNGGKATVYEVVSDGRLIGARDFEGGRFGCEWNASGRVVLGEEHHIDLMPPREKLFRYAAIYSNGVVNVWCNSANIVKHDNQLVAIVPIEIEYTEGEGL